jgi:hypothetical protein
MNVFLGVAASYLLVAILGVALGRIWAELEHREAVSWPAVPEVDWSVAEPYNWDREGVLL